MSMKDQLKVRRTELATLSNQANTLYGDVEKAGDKATGEDRTKLNNLMEAGKAKRIEVEQIETLVENEEAAKGGNGDVNSRTHESPDGNGRGAFKSAGQQVIESAEYQTARKSPNARSMDPVVVKNLLAGSAVGQGGAFVRPDRQEEIVGLPQRPVSILDYINTSRTESNAVEYVEHATRVNNAAPVAEPTTVAGATAKPESDLTFALRTAAVKTIATWIPATRQILQDAPRLSDIVDVELPYLLRQKLEDQVLTGDGTGVNFTGILATSGIQSRVHQVSGRGFTATDTIADTLRRSITDLALEFYVPDVIMLNPAQGEKLELTKDANGNYVKVFDPIAFRVWRVQVVETVAITAGTALTMAGRMACTLWDREQTEVRVGEPNDYFVKNLVAVLAEMRAAFAVVRPKAIEKATGL